VGIWRYLYQVKAGFFGKLTGLFRIDDATILSFGVDKLNFGDADLIVDPGPFLDGRGSTIGSANGRFSLRCCEQSA
jgi:hypothetical protein